MKSLSGRASFGNPDNAAVTRKIKTLPGYERAFAQAFPNDKDPVQPENWGKAIGAYERTLVTPSPFDAYLKGDPKALTPQAQAGLKLFIDVGCVSCHNGVAVGGATFQKFGVVGDYWKETESQRFQWTSVLLSSLFVGRRFGRATAGATRATHDFPVRPAPFHAWLKTAFGIVLIALACSGCGAPAPLRGGPYLGLTPREVMARGSAHDSVRWGGHLDRHARPWKTGGNQGSFIACAPGFYDPRVYVPGRMLTIVGRLHQLPRHGEQRLVLVSAEKIYLWHGWEGKWELRSCD